MNNFVGIPRNFPVFFSNFSCFHQYSKFDVLCIGAFDKYAVSKH